MRQHAFDAAYNSKNIGEIAGRTFDRLVFSGAQSKKWWANANPEADWNGIEAALSPLASVNAARPVLISTVDVLPDRKGLDESFDPHGQSAHPYGAHRLRIEDRLRALWPNLLIVRLPALFGRGLKKNVIYDLLTNNMLEAIQPESSFQYYDLERLWADIGVAEAAGLELIHLFPAPVRTRDIVERFFASLSIGANAGAPVHYDFRTRHGALYGGTDGYLYGREETMRRLEAFIVGSRRQAGA